MKQINLNESQLKKIVAESIKNVLSELDWKTYANAADKDGAEVSKQIEEYVYGWIDYIYNEGVIAYDDRHLVAYKDGKLKPDFKEIVNGVLSSYKNIDNTTQIVLRKYLKNGAPKDKESSVEKAIMAAIRRFVEYSNCESF